ncbi:PREDICTED: putative uncharacterized protein FLJ46214 [Hipposideros armiger]|uniref:Uncharacterized protein n=1 Tax=Hipposideros armiger TaxID=186990 RepID=A0A8B7T8E5_HIPAR|nr:PREDICTED: putative uncharacterized protein FLJ46214 [Hipposideros armiger]
MNCVLRRRARPCGGVFQGKQELRDRPVFSPAQPGFPSPQALEPPTRGAPGESKLTSVRGAHTRRRSGRASPTSGIGPRRLGGRRAHVGVGERGGGAGRGGAARPRPPRGYTEGRPRAQPALCSAAIPALLSAQTSEAAVTSQPSRVAGPRRAPAARPPPPPPRGPCAAPVSCQISGHAEGPQARGSLGALAGAEGLGWGRREPRPAARSCPETTL